MFTRLNNLLKISHIKFILDDVVVWLGQCCSVELQSRYAQTIRYHDMGFLISHISHHVLSSLINRGVNPLG